MPSSISISLPSTLVMHRAAAESYVTKGLVKEIAFSGSTYQVEVEDVEAGESVWVFLQLDQRGQIRDSFCSSSIEEDVSACAHIAAAFLRIYNGFSSPLHSRFAHSLWHHLYQLTAESIGYTPDILEQLSKGHYQYTSDKGTLIYYIKGKSERGIQQLEQIIENQPKETEENSLKFSNRTPEEIRQWREGSPSPQLRYELSFWSDLAKWLMLLQDANEPYRLTFEHTNQELPHHVIIHFADIEVGFALNEAYWRILIPALATVESPLIVHQECTQAIDKVTYDQAKGSLHFEIKSGGEETNTSERAGASIDGWKYIPNDGFYPQTEHILLKKNALVGKEITQALNDYHELISTHLTNAKVYADTISVSYHLSFDEEWNLHVNCYAFEPGDMSKPFSRCFGNWIYLENDGFYHIEGMLFDTPQKVVLAHEMGDFITQHRLWLNSQAGFETHVTSAEAHLTYSVTEEGYLLFKTYADRLNSNEYYDFGSWIYIANQGFYAKTHLYVDASVRPGMSIPPGQIPLFLHIHREELKLIKGFFSSKSPIAFEGLKVEINSRGAIIVTPSYKILPEYSEKQVRFFYTYVYVAELGFSELPRDHTIPEKFQQPVVILPAEQTNFLTQELDAIRPHLFSIDSRLCYPQTISLIADNMEIVSEPTKEMYGLQMRYETEQGSVDVGMIWSAIRQKKRFIFSKAGLIDLEDPRFKWLKTLNKDQVDAKQNRIQLSTLEFIKLNAFDEVISRPQIKNEYAQLSDFLSEMKEFRTPELPNLSGLNSHLRPYQEKGTQWLWFLYHHQLSGLLCDDMGLGKTHQAMALIAAATNRCKDLSEKEALEKSAENIVLNENKPPMHFLVICPTSVMYHWQEKLKAFLPHLRVYTFYGLNRDINVFDHEYDLLLTSYGIWRRESNTLRAINFEIAIFDEIQIAKNHQSRLHSSLLYAKAKMKVGLTGTPIENRLRELKSLFDLVLPSYMPPEADFSSFFIKPIERDGNQKRQALLSRFIKPFILRRKKEHVLLDLPEKIEEIAHCGLASEQRQMYREVLLQSRNQLMQLLEDEKSPIPYMHIFAVLTSLKQICNHPAAYLKQPFEYQKHHSGKWELFLELLNEARDSQQKVVVFSQYLAMLDIITHYLDDHGISYATIRGATINRGEQLQMFNSDPKCEVFVASLQAAGLGVDLTAASVVIHYDRWWNAARENQATDRVHRIGQTRGVQVFKLVTKGTFEERIDELITKKGKLMEEVIGVDEHQLIKQFDRQDLLSLLKDIEGEEEISSDMSEE